MPIIETGFRKAKLPCWDESDPELATYDYIRSFAYARVRRAREGGHSALYRELWENLSLLTGDSGPPTKDEYERFLYFLNQPNDPLCCQCRCHP